MVSSNNTTTRQRVPNKGKKMNYGTVWGESHKFSLVPTTGSRTNLSST